MQIILNGQNKPITPDLTINQLIQTLDLANKRYALELNQQIIPRSQYHETFLNDGDRVEIIHAVGGG
jgi:sulfur carrier protein